MKIGPFCWSNRENISVLLFWDSVLIDWLIDWLIDRSIDCRRSCTRADTGGLLATSASTTDVAMWSSWTGRTSPSSAVDGRACWRGLPCSTAPPATSPQPSTTHQTIRRSWQLRPWPSPPDLKAKVGVSTAGGSGFRAASTVGVHQSGLPIQVLGFA